MILNKIVEEFEMMDLEDRTYLANIGLKRSLIKIERFQEILYGTVMQFSDSAISPVFRDSS
jgi:hypothetical protein